MNAPLRRVCFMIMPYGTKKTDAPTAGRGLAEIDFDALWDLELCPAIDAMGFEPVRADQDVGALRPSMPSRASISTAPKRTAFSTRPRTSC